MHKNFALLGYFLGSILIVGFIAKSLDFVVDKSDPVTTSTPTPANISCSGVAPEEGYICECINDQCLWIQK